MFCRLASARSALPTPWPWGPFLLAAAELLPFAFEKSDAKEKYGGENIFQGMMGGRSLRCQVILRLYGFTAAVVLRDFAADTWAR